MLPDGFRAARRAGLWVEVEYYGSRVRAVPRCSTSRRDRTAAEEGLYKAADAALAAAKPWACSASGAPSSRCPTSTAPRTQNLGASFRLEFRRELLITRVAVSLAPPPDLASFPATAPVPELRKLPGRFYPINYLFVEITNACNFKCTWCPDEIMDRRRGFMKKERVFRLVDEIAQKRSFLGRSSR